MNAEIISVGTELLLGHTINTDAAFVARELSAIGVNLLFACTVGDNPGRLRDALEEALGRSDVVITTGGLGPMDDDLTKETIASVAGAPLKIHEDSLRRLKALLDARRYGEPVARPCRLEALIRLPQRHRDRAGLRRADGVRQGDRHAAGAAFRTGPHVAALCRPVPERREPRRHPLVHDPHVRARRGGGRVEDCRSDRCGEPDGGDLCEGKRDVPVRVTARAESEEAAEALCRPVVEEICRRYGDVVYGVDVDNLESVVVRSPVKKWGRIWLPQNPARAVRWRNSSRRFRRVGSLRHGPRATPTKPKMKPPACLPPCLRNTGP